VNAARELDERYLEASRLHLGRILERTVTDPRVVRAFESVPRHLFVPDALRVRAYEDRPLPLVQGQTISQPSMVAIMLEALRVMPDDRVLEIGAGSGYAAALLGRLAREVHGVELRPELALMAERSLAAADVLNVRIHVGDGSRGLPELAPFDRILVSAGAHHVPRELLSELAPNGRIVIPVDHPGGQLLHVGSRDSEGGIEWEESVACVFVPLVQAD
jgi:protein-L-isoaspartate(D-aspartate) O-methyltransferase